MLSKILRSREAARVEPPGFSNVPANPNEEHRAEPEPAVAVVAEDTSGLREEIRALHDRCRHLENEVAAAKRDSFEAGFREGDRQARAETAPILERLSLSLGQLAELRQEIRLRAEKDMIRLALMIAKRVLHRELSTDTGALTALARVVFERMVRGEKLHVVVHPQFAPALAAALTQTQNSRVHIDPDPNWPLGTLVVRSEEGMLDASVDAQLEEISRGLTDRISRN